jgi:hypothetical protein
MFCYKACSCTVLELWIISGSCPRFWLRTLKNTNHERLFLSKVASTTLENYRNKRTSTQFNLCPLFNDMTFFTVTYVWHFYTVPFPLRNKLLKLSLWLALRHTWTSALHSLYFELGEQNGSKIYIRLQSKVHPRTGTEALYRPYGPYREKRYSSTLS